MKSEFHDGALVALNEGIVHWHASGMNSGCAGDSCREKMFLKGAPNKSKGTPSPPTKDRRISFNMNEYRWSSIL
jgi:hypothetical protein